MDSVSFFTLSMDNPLSTPVAFADAGTSGISDAADGVVTYMPYVRALCYVIAAIIAVVGALAVYYTMQTNPQNTAKRMTMTVGGALTFVCLSLALPQFFGIDGSMSGNGGSSTGSGTSGTGDGFLASDQGGISQSGIITELATGLPFRKEPIWLLPISLSISMSISGQEQKVLMVVHSTISSVNTGVATWTTTPSIR